MRSEGRSGRPFIFLTVSARSSARAWLPLMMRECLLLADFVVEVGKSDRGDLLEPSLVIRSVGSGGFEAVGLTSAQLRPTFNDRWWWSRDQLRKLA
jgi:hypothetical protein